MAALHWSKLQAPPGFQNWWQAHRHFPFPIWSRQFHRSSAATKTNLPVDVASYHGGHENDKHQLGNPAPRQSKHVKANDDAWWYMNDIWWSQTWTREAPKHCSTHVSATVWPLVGLSPPSLAEKLPHRCHNLRPWRTAHVSSTCIPNQTVIITESYRVRNLPYTSYIIFYESSARLSWFALHSVEVECNVRRGKWRG